MCHSIHAVVLEYIYDYKSGLFLQIDSCWVTCCLYIRTYYLFEHVNVQFQHWLHTYILVLNMHAYDLLFNIHIY